jgi:hypothetical protein
MFGREGELEKVRNSKLTAFTSHCTAQNLDQEGKAVATHIIRGDEGARMCMWERGEGGERETECVCVCVSRRAPRAVEE